MAAEPQKPHWHQPSHPAIQRVVHSPTSSPTDFSTKSYSTVTVPPYGVYTVLNFPPITIAEKGATYATVQIGKDTHINLECDLLYVEHSCDPSLIFDTNNALSPTSPRITILAGPRGLSPGDELTFFYPSTEWHMAQGFSCHCSSTNCLGWIQGASKLSIEQLEGNNGTEKRWVSDHIRALIKERGDIPTSNGNGTATNGIAGKGLDKKDSFEKSDGYTDGINGSLENGEKSRKQRGVTSRAMSGEMGGDTSNA